MKHYVVVMRHTRMHLVGPFETQKEASDWGKVNNPDDDPRWQTIQLEEAQTMRSKYSPFCAVSVLCPDQNLPSAMRSVPGVDNDL